MINSNLHHILHRLAIIARNNFQGNPRSVIYTSFENQYSTSY